MNRIRVCITLGVLVQTCLVGMTAGRESRRLGVGENVPEFSAVDLSGRTFDYKHGHGRVVVVAFLSAGQKRSSRAAADLGQTFTELGDQAKQVDLVVATHDPNTAAHFRKDPNALGNRLHITLDTHRKLWGMFGVIVTPTVFISNKDGKVVWVEAGYPYDFAQAIRVHLRQALGLDPGVAPADLGRVKTVANDSIAARVKRHLRLAAMLEGKGRLDSAMRELRSAQQLDPNSVQVALKLAQLHCRSGQAAAALKVLGRTKGAGRLEKATVNLLGGWANRQLGRLDVAEKMLLQATKLDPNLARAFFELGRVYHAREQCDKAVDAYFRALTLVFASPNQPAPILSTDNGSPR